MASKTYKVTTILVSPIVKPEALENTSVMLFRDFLRANLTDPIASTRTLEYVYTNHPTSNVEYPHVVVYFTGGVGDRIGGNSWAFDFFVNYTFDTLHKNVAGLAEISDDLVKILKTNMNTFHDWGLQRVRWLSISRWNPMPGVRDVYRRTTELAFHVHIP